MANLAAAPDLEVAALCESCRKAVFEDKGFASEEASDDSGKYLKMVFDGASNSLETKYFLSDVLPGLPKLNDSASRGCEFCHFLQEIILSRDSEDYIVSREGMTFAALGAREVYISIFYDWKTENEHESPFLYSMRIKISIEGFEKPIELRCLAEAATGSDDVAKWLGLRKSSQSYMTKEAIHWMKRQIKDCVEHQHDLIDENYIPERLLDVQQRPPRLVRCIDLQSLRKTRSGTSNRVRYAALSYCWGSAEDSLSQTKSTSESLAQSLAIGIPESQMTAVVRDAIRITKALSIPYLWIDAICILQGDDLDWEHNCLNMDRIYGSAYVTFCAASSTSCHEGFLSQRGRRIRVSFCSYLQPTIFGSYYLQFKYVVPWAVTTSRRLIPNGSLHDDISRCRWNRRTWTIQESFLSRHMIIFGNSNIHSNCDSAHGSMGGETLGGGYLSSVSGVLSPLDKVSLHREWDDLMSQYSESGEYSLTKPSDILPALAGPARIFQHRLQDDYISGHWESDLFRNLMWFQEGKLSKFDYISRLQLHSPHVPSWSRLLKANYTNSIWNYRDLCQEMWPEYNRIVPEVLLAGSSPFGATRHSKIRLTTVVLNPIHVLQMRETPKDSHCVFRCESDFDENQSPFFPYFLLGGKSEGLRAQNSPENLGTQAFRLVLLGSCDVCPHGSAKARIHEPGCRGSFGLVVHAVSNTSMFWRVGLWRETRRELVLV